MSKLLKGLLKNIDIENTSVVDLKQKVMDFKKNLMALRFQEKLGDSVNRSMYKKLRRAIAVILTHIASRKKDLRKVNGL